jgi:hypothetical protein
MKKISSSKRGWFLKNIILHTWLFLTFGEYDKGTMLKNAMPGFVLQIGSVDAHLHLWYNVPLERCTLRS